MLPLPMPTCLALLTLLAIAAIAAVAAFVGRRRRTRGDVEPPWGAAVERPRDLAAVDRAYRCNPASAPRTEANDRVWKDLGLAEVFRRVDRCITGAGQTTLYRHLREPSVSHVEHADLQRRVGAFASDEALRRDVWRALTPLAKAHTLELAPVLHGGVARAPRGAGFLPLLPLATLAFTALSVAWPFAVVPLLFCLVGSVAGRLYVHEAMSAHAVVLGSLVHLLAAAERLASLESHALVRELVELRRALAQVRGFRLAAWWLTLDTLRMNEFAAVFMTYLNVFLLLDVLAFLRSVTLARDHAPALRVLLDRVGEVDAARAIASFRAGTTTSVPVFGDRGAPIVVRAMVHPLVDRAVPNDVILDRARGWLVLGSNMSGKSTCLRALALNAWLAQSIGCVTASAYSAPFLSIRTLIHVEDDLEAGKSHFLAEARAARDLMEHDGTVDRLTVIDELFRGTNTADRVAAAAAVLGAIHRSGAFVVAATHDAELIPILAGRFRPHYFEDILDGETMTFDYRLHEGAVAPRNALLVLERVGFPPEVVAEARAVVATATRALAPPACSCRGAHPRRCGLRSLAITRKGYHGRHRR
jgi:hypothetical protein